VFSWSATSNDHGSAVTSYTINFKHSDGTYSTYLTSCDGSDATIFAAKQCTVAMSVFTSSPYSYSVGDLIVATVQATNVLGASIASPVNTGGSTAKTVPTVGPTPSSGSSTSYL
jgi:hypothetical protein